MNPFSLLTTRDVALGFRVSSRTIERWMKKQRLPHRLTGGGHARFELGEVRAWATRRGLTFDERAAA